MAAAAEKEIKLPPQHGIPGRYAAALYMAAVKGGTLSKVEQELGQVASLMGESKEFSSFVSDPSVPRHAKIDGLNSVLTKMGATDITKNFIGGWVGGWVPAVGSVGDVGWGGIARWAALRGLLGGGAGPWAERGTAGGRVGPTGGADSVPPPCASPVNPSPPPPTPPPQGC